MVAVTTSSEGASSAGGTAGGYRAVAASLRVRITGSGFPDGRLPTEAVLVQEFGVARDTVRRALALLVEEGLIRSTHGRGHFVVGTAASNGKDVGLPRYGVVATALRDRITAGVLRPGDRVPSEATLQAEFEVSRTTARRALLALETDGLIERRDGRRVVLSPPPAR